MYKSTILTFILLLSATSVWPSVVKFKCAYLDYNNHEVSQEQRDEIKASLTAEEITALDAEIAEKKQEAEANGQYFNEDFYYIKRLRQQIISETVPEFDGEGNLKPGVIATFLGELDNEGKGYVTINGSVAAGLESDPSQVIPFGTMVRKPFYFVEKNKSSSKFDLIVPGLRDKIIALEAITDVDQFNRALAEIKADLADDQERAQADELVAFDGWLPTYQKLSFQNKVFDSEGVNSFQSFFTMYRSEEQIDERTQEELVAFQQNAQTAANQAAQVSGGVAQIIELEAADNNTVEFERMNCRRIK